MLDTILEWYDRIFVTPKSFDDEGYLRETPLSIPRKNALSLTGTCIPMFQGPLVRTPLSDLFCVASNQEGGSFCAHLEMMLLNCMEQYGYERGSRLCNGYVLDLEECKYHNLEELRNKIMWSERQRQIKAGERKVPYGPTPSYDSF